VCRIEKRVVSIGVGVVKCKCSECVILHDTMPYMYTIHILITVYTICTQHTGIIGEMKV
jgi:hypothetical protein